MWSTRAPYIALLVGWAPASAVGLQLYSERHGLVRDHSHAMSQDPVFFIMYVVASLGAAILLANSLAPQWQLSSTFSWPNLGRLLVTILLTTAAWSLGWAFLQSMRNQGPPVYFGIDIFMFVVFQFLFFSPIVSVVLFEILERWKTAITKMGGRYLYCYIVTNVFGPGLVSFLLLTLDN